MFFALQVPKRDAADLAADDQMPQTPFCSWSSAPPTRVLETTFATWRKRMNCRFTFLPRLPTYGMAIQSVA